jgi:hypothetical protein
MMLGIGRKSERGTAFQFRVSDVVATPLRGTLLRLRLIEGEPSMQDLGVGSALRLQRDGAERRVRITAHAVTGGRATQRRLERARELDVIVADETAGDAPPIDIGWLASGPVREDDAAD